jgi:16S rRNA (adenine1518-N6/adenine1519-N6)-dimethyltransferase
MPLTNPSELLTFLRALGVGSKKGLSQNFLIDGNIVAKILKEASLRPGDTVLEIGPGPGALTEALVAQGAKVYAVEKDPIFAEALKRFKNVEVFAKDIRDFELSVIPEKTKVISNLPYHLTAPILTLLVRRHDLFSTLTVMVQEEVARRMIAKPKTKDYGSLSVFLNFYSQPRYAFKVSRHCFYPQPKVDSAVVALTLEKPPQDTEGFLSFVRTAFQYRRKMIKTTLGEPIGDILKQLGENPKSRPEDLSLDTFLKVFTKFSQKL